MGDWLRDRALENGVTSEGLDTLKRGWYFFLRPSNGLSRRETTGLSFQTDL